MSVRIFIICAFLFGSLAKAQLQEYYFNEKLVVEFSFRWGTIQTHGVSADSVKGLQAFVFRPSALYKSNYSPAGYQGSHRWAFLPETLMEALFQAVRGTDLSLIYQNTSTYVSDFILGWHHHAWSLVSQPSLNVAAGVGWGDYFLGYEPYIESLNTYLPAREPAGWYGGLGPAIISDLELEGLIVLHAEFSYMATIRFSEFPEMTAKEGFPSPHFFNFHLQLRNSTRFNLGVEYVRSLNRGDSNYNASRFDVFLGFSLYKK